MSKKHDGKDYLGPGPEGWMDINPSPKEIFEVK